MGPGDELEEDGTGDVYAMLIVEEEEDEMEVKEDGQSETVKEHEVSQLEDDLDILTLNIDKVTAEEMLTTEQSVPEIQPAKVEAEVEAPKAVEDENTEAKLKNKEQLEIVKEKDENEVASTVEHPGVLTVKIAQETVVDNANTNAVITEIQNPKVDAKLKQTKGD